MIDNSVGDGEIIDVEGFKMTRGELSKVEQCIEEMSGLMTLKEYFFGLDNGVPQKQPISSYRID